jgi:hypothetical protein
MAADEPFRPPGNQPIDLVCRNQVKRNTTNHFNISSPRPPASQTSASLIAKSFIVDGSPTAREIRRVGDLNRFALMEGLASASDKPARWERNCD